MADEVTKEEITYPDKDTMRGDLLAAGMHVPPHLPERLLQARYRALLQRRKREAEESAASPE